MVSGRFSMKNHEKISIPYILYSCAGPDIITDLSVDSSKHTDIPRTPMTIINVFVRFMNRKEHPHSPRYPNLLENRAPTPVTIRQPVPGSRAVQKLNTVYGVCDHLRSAVRSLDII